MDHTLHQLLAHLWAVERRLLELQQECDALKRQLAERDADG